MKAEVENEELVVKVRIVQGYVWRHPLPCRWGNHCVQLLCLRWVVDITPLSTPARRCVNRDTPWKRFVLTEHFAGSIFAVEPTHFSVVLKQLKQSLIQSIDRLVHDLVNL